MHQYLFRNIAISKDSKLQRYPEWKGMEINAYATVRDWVLNRILYEIFWKFISLYCLGYQKSRTRAANGQGQGHLFRTGYL